MSIRLSDDEGFPTVCDTVFAVVVADQRGRVAVLYFARSQHYGTPLVLLDWAVLKLAPPPWVTVEARLAALGARCRPRYGIGGIYAEGAALAAQAAARGAEARPILEHVAKPDYWASLTLTAAHHLNSGSVRLTRLALDKAERGKFGALPVLSHEPRNLDPKTEDPTIPAWLYGIALALDEAAASPPEPARVKLVA